MMEQYINEVIRPKIQGDGGEITFLSQVDRIVTVVVQGECSKCLILDRCIKWIEAEIKREFDLDVTVRAVRKKPFFWDT